MVAEGDGRKQDAEKVRAGSTEHVVRYVLGISITLAVLAMIVVGLMF